jgi:uncharacterized protein (TIGR02145 family)
MKTYLTLVLLIFTSVCFSQKEKKERIDFNTEIYPLLEVKNYEKALPLLHAYYNQNLLLGELWRPKVILLESKAMFLAEELLGDNYFKKAENSGKQLDIDSSRVWYNRMIANFNPDSTYAKQQLNIINVNEVTWKNAGPLKEQKIKEEQQRLKNLETERLAAEEARKKQEQLDRENEQRASEQAALKAEQLILMANKAKADSLNSINQYKTVDVMISAELPKLTTLALCNSFVSKLQKYQKEQNLLFTLIPEYMHNFYIYNVDEEGVEESISYFTTQNLNQNTFRNGDVIQEAKTKEEWVQLCNEGKPAWCYYSFDANNKFPYGKYYNIPAITDKRGLAPHGWKIASQSDYLNLINIYGDNEEDGSHMITTNFELLGAEFSGVLAGFMIKEGFEQFDKIGAFATNEKNEDDDLMVFYISSDNGLVDFFSTKNQNEIGLNVRCAQLDLDQSSVFNSIPNLKKLLTKRDQLIFEELKKQTNQETSKAFLLKQHLSESNLVSVENSMDRNDNYLAEKLFERVNNNDMVTKNGSVFFLHDYNEYAEDLFYLIAKLNYSNGEVNKITYDDGTTYTGPCNGSYPNGNGKLTIVENGYLFGIQNEAVSSFEGDVDGASIADNGTLKFKDKSVYVGEHSEGTPNGIGKLTTAAGVVQDGEFVDGVYKKPFSCKTAVIGNQTWMAENLTVTKFQNGDAILEAKTAAEWEAAAYNRKPAFCYHNNDPSTVSTNGILYNWFAVTDARGLSPEGWKIPSHVDVNQLIDYTNAELKNAENEIVLKENQGINSKPTSDALYKKYSHVNSTANSKSKSNPLLAATKLKSSKGWQTSISSDCNGTNTYGFNAKPCFARSSSGGFTASPVSSDFSMWTCFQIWTSSSYGSQGVYFQIDANIYYSLPDNENDDNGNVKIQYHYGMSKEREHQGTGFNVRCIKK